MKQRETALSIAKTAEMLQISPHTVKRIIGENEELVEQGLLYVGGSETKRFVYASQIQHLHMNLPPEDIPDPLADDDGDLGAMVVQEDDDAGDSPADAAQIAAAGRHEAYQVKKDGKVIETWGRPPTEEEIENAYGPGEYVILRRDTRSNITTGADRIRVNPGAQSPATSPVAAQLAELQQTMQFAQQCVPQAGVANNGVEYLLTMQQNQIESLRKENSDLRERIITLSTTGGRQNDFSETLTMISQIREASELFAGSAGHDAAGGSISDRAVDKLVNTLAESSPALLEIFQQKLSASQAQTPQGPPAPGPETQQSIGYRPEQFRPTAGGGQTQHIDLTAAAKEEIEKRKQQYGHGDQK